MARGLRSRAAEVLEPSSWDTLYTCRVLRGSRGANGLLHRAWPHRWAVYPAATREWTVEQVYLLFRGCILPAWNDVRDMGRSYQLAPPRGAVPGSHTRMEVVHCVLGIVRIVKGGGILSHPYTHAPPTLAADARVLGEVLLATPELTPNSCC